VKESNDPFDEVIDIAYRPCLAAIAGDRERFASYGLPDERRDGSAITRTHPWTESIKNTYDSGVDLVRLSISHRQGFRKAFRLVIDAPGTDRVYIAAIGLRLWMYERIAVTLRSGGEQESGILLSS